jgi:hypothetical protein
MMEARRQTALRAADNLRYPQECVTLCTVLAEGVSGCRVHELGAVCRTWLAPRVQSFSGPCPNAYLNLFAFFDLFPLFRKTWLFSNLY